MQGRVSAAALPPPEQRTSPLVAVAGVIAVVGVLACGIPAAVADAAASYPGSNGRLLFIRFERFTYAYSSRADGSGARRIVKADFASWSPNGRRIAYADADRGVVQVVNANGGSVETMYSGIDPTWSPDGKELALVAFPQHHPEIVLVRTDGRVGARQLTSGFDRKFQPSWSPDGSQIAYSVGYGEREITDDIFAVSPSGGAPRQLTSGPALDSDPSWSPDGRMLLFTRRLPGQPAHIYSLDLETNAIRQITDDPRSDDAAVWSPDGRQIAFSRYVNGQTRLWLVNADGSDERAINNSVPGDHLADWQRTIDLAVQQRVRVEGRRIRITITLTNRSPGAGTAVLVVRLPPGTRVFAKTPGCYGGMRVLCRYRPLAANSRRTVTLIVTRPRARGQSRVTALGAVADPNTANNVAAASLAPRRR